MPALLNIGILFHLFRLQRHKLFSWLATRGFFEKIASHNEREWQAPNLSPRVIRLCNCSPWHYRASAIDRNVACEILLLPIRRIYFQERTARSRVSREKYMEILTQIKILTASNDTPLREIAPADARVWRMYAYLLSKSRDDLWSVGEGRQKNNLCAMCDQN